MFAPVRGKSGQEEGGKAGLPVSSFYRILSHMQPERVGRYRIERLIGEGGMGLVYLASRDDGEFERRVALKLVRRGLHLDPRIIRRFRTEREILAGLSHPGIARLYDGGLTEDNLPYFAMEFVDGLPIDRYCAAHALGVDARLELFARVCDAAAHAHSRQIVHRDIKPSNLLVTDSGDPRLLDFGIAKLLDTDQETGDTTRRSERLLTPEYASPEQLRGEVAGVASDVWSLGVLLYVLLTDRRPFPRAGRTPHEMERAVFEEDPVRPSDTVEGEALRRRLRGDLDAIVLTALRFQPEQRYASAAELGADVRRHLQGDAVFARRASHGYRMRRWARRHRLGLSTTAAALLGAGVIFAAAMQWNRPRGDRVLQSLRLAQATHFTNDEELELDPAISPDGSEIAYAAGVEAAMRIVVRPREGGRARVVSEGLGGQHRRPQWSPDGSSLLFMAEGGIWLVPASGGSPRLVVERPPNDSAGIAHSPTWSPDGRALAWVAWDTLYVRPVEGGAVRALFSASTLHSLAWSPDGRWIAAVVGNHEFAHHKLGNLGPSAIHLVPAHCAAPSDCASLLLAAPSSLNVSPAWLDASRLVFISNRGGARDLFAKRVDPRGDSAEAVRLSAGQDLHSVAAAADGRSLAYAVFRQRSNIWSLDVSGRTPRELSEATRITTGQQTIEGIDLSPDGQWLAFDANRAGQQDIYVVRATGGEPERVVATPDDDFHPDWSPDGTTLAFYTFRDGVRRAATVPARGGAVRLVHPGGPLLEQHSPVWTPDGNGLVYWRNYPYGTQLWTVRKEGDTTWGPDRQVTRRGGVALTFSKDGRRSIYIGVAPGNVFEMGPDLDEVSARLLYPARQPGRRSVRVDNPIISPDGTSFIARGEDGVSHGFWRIPLDGGAPVLLVRLNDATRIAPRTEFATDGRRLFFTLTEREADVWSVRLEER